MESIASINPKYFAAINLFSANCDVRYYLNGVFIEPHPEKGVIIVATDGHFLGLIHDPEGFVDRPIIVGGISKPLISACSVMGSAKKGSAPTTLYICANVPYGPGGAIVQSGDTCTGDVDPFSIFTTHMSKIEIIDAKYPYWRRVVPSKSEPSIDFPRINARFFTVLDKVGSLIVPKSKSYGCGLDLESRGEKLSVVARFMQGDIGDRFVGVLMPMQRDDKAKSILPEWLMPTIESEKVS